MQIMPEGLQNTQNAEERFGNSKIYSQCVLYAQDEMLSKPAPVKTDDLSGQVGGGVC